MGRQGLAVFATGTVLSMFFQVVKTTREPEWISDGLMLGTALLVLWALAWTLTKTQQLSRAPAETN
jgi:hypothetical protein